MEINRRVYKQPPPAGHVQVRGSRRGVARRDAPPPPSSPFPCPKKTQVQEGGEGNFGTKKLIHKQATQGARTGNLKPSVKPSSLWRQEAARPRQDAQTLAES